MFRKLCWISQYSYKQFETLLNIKMPSRQKRIGMSKRKMSHPRRNSSSNMPRDISEKISGYSSPKIHRVSSDEVTCHSSERDTCHLNCFNDMGHLSRRIFNDGGERHFNSCDFENTFGYRKAFEDQAEFAVTPATIARCIGSIVHGLIMRGEKKYGQGHYNAPTYEAFCGYV